MTKTIDLNRPLADLLKERKACPEAVEWAKEYKTAAEAWEECRRPDWMLWALERIAYGDEKLRLFACWCVRETPLANGRKVWDLLTDDRSKAAVDVAERFARGGPTEEELTAARAAAWAAANDAVWAAANDAVWAAQANALRKIVGNPFQVKRQHGGAGGG